MTGEKLGSLSMLFLGASFLGVGFFAGAGLGALFAGFGDAFGAAFFGSAFGAGFSAFTSLDFGASLISGASLFMLVTLFIAFLPIGILDNLLCELCIFKCAS